MDLRKGQWAEDEALKFYLKKGYKLIGRNIRGYGGEIDLVLFKDREIVLVEVKQRRYSEEDALLSVTDGKKKLIIKTWYSKGGDYLKYPFRVEMCVVIGTKENYLLNVYREEL